jgi:hypothetical protein
VEHRLLVAGDFVFLVFTELSLCHSTGIFILQVPQKSALVRMVQALQIRTVGVSIRFTTQQMWSSDPQTATLHTSALESRSLVNLS